MADQHSEKASDIAPEDATNESVHSQTSKQAEGSIHSKRSTHSKKSSAHSKPQSKNSGEIVFNRAPSEKSRSHSSKQKMTTLQRRLQLAEEEAEIKLNLIKIKQDMLDLEEESQLGDEDNHEFEDGAGVDQEEEEEEHPRQGKHDDTRLQDSDTYLLQKYIKEQQELVFTQNNTHSETMTIANELSKYMFKKDMVLSRLERYDDAPEHYLSWKSSFKSIVKDIGATAPEELDLLVKYLGQTSSKHAVSLKSSNVGREKTAVELLWKRLDERFGSPEIIDQVLKGKLNAFPKISKDSYSKLYELSDLITEIESVKANGVYGMLFSYYDTSLGVNPIVQKLPFYIQNKWTEKAIRYKSSLHVPYPPFSLFAEFIRDCSRAYNDPSFKYNVSQNDSAPPKGAFSRDTNLVVRPKKTDVNNSFVHCLLHTNGSHQLEDCRGFRSLPLDERRKILKQNNSCFKCCESGHSFNNCTAKLSCKICKRSNHTTAMHRVAFRQPFQPEIQPTPDHQADDPESNQGGEQQKVTSKFTRSKQNDLETQSCSKTVPVIIYAAGKPENKIVTYAVIDDQSNRTLATSRVFDKLDSNAPKIIYKLSSCQGSIETMGRDSENFIVESIDGSSTFHLPRVIECDNIPNNKDEVCTKESAARYPHLRSVADDIPPLYDADISILIGRDLPEVHHVLDQQLGPTGTPFAQKLSLGWVIIGEVCTGQVHATKHVSVKRTNVLNSGRATLLTPCPNNLHIDVFQRTPHDNEVAMSVEDKQFIELMDAEMTKTKDGLWSAPLPFKQDRQRLPNNRNYALQRARNVDRNLRKNHTKRDNLVAFMANLLARGHATEITDLNDDDECWYLPLFGVYHPKKPGKVRGVFDSSAQYQGVSLNDVLLKGPDLTNSLLGVLMKFRSQPVAVAGDIEQMFYSFKVREDHRRFLRFIWYKDNDPTKEMVDYNMTVHVFGNSPSPAVATYGLRKCVEGNDVDSTVQQFVNDNFYVDDGLGSFATSKDAISVMKETQQILHEQGRLRLHKIVSNDKEVLEAFNTSDLVPELVGIDLDQDLPQQRSLGLLWNLNSDCFTYSVHSDDMYKPFTRRGVLSTINSLFDPVGFITPCILKGKFLLRELMSNNSEWDAPLPECMKTTWEHWRNSLKDLSSISVPRCYDRVNTDIEKNGIEIYCDASEKAISAVGYIRDNSQSPKLSFLLGKAKLAPTHGHTIPRLELCAAVLAVEIGLIIQEHLNFPISKIKFFTDSKVVLGYIYNESRRFYLYVANRVNHIRQYSQPDQWNFVRTDINPADQGSRGLSPRELQGSMWLNGPKFVSDSNVEKSSKFEMIEPQGDKELRPENIKVCATSTNPVLFTSWISRFERFSSWTRLVKAIASIKRAMRLFKNNDKREIPDVEMRQEAEDFIIKTTQRQTLSDEISALSEKAPLLSNSTILTLNPFLDDNGICRVGGRLSNAELTTEVKHPIIIPGKSHVAKLLVSYFHQEVEHQGKLFTEGKVRGSGYWIPGVKGLIRSIIWKCVSCRKQRGRQQQQLMADLPADRLTPGPPFSFVGVDAFGPWSVVTRKTRGGVTNNKRWGILFTCLTTRAIHIEVVEEMSASSFVNALKRFVSIRGNVKIFRSDQGSNFVGAADILNADAINIENREVSEYLTSKRSVWVFNPPHAPHMGGVWERLIGIVKRVLDSILTRSEYRHQKLTHEVLTTLMAEVSAIVNNRPITAVSTDPDDPTILSPSTILTQKNEANVSNFPTGNFNLKDMYRHQWKMVEHLADQFWTKWKKEYLWTLQQRTKWKESKMNIKNGDIVLVRDDTLHRNEWPVGRIENAVSSKDGHVRKVKVRVTKEGKMHTYTRPINELVLLVEG